MKNQEWPGDKATYSIHSFTFDIKPVLRVVGPLRPLVGREERLFQYPVGVERHTVVGVATHLLQPLRVACPTLHHHVVSTGRVKTLWTVVDKNISLYLCERIVQH